MFDRNATEGAVFGDDAQAVVAGVFGPCREAVGREGLGHHLECRAERPVDSLFADGLGHVPSHLDADLLGHRLGLVGRQEGEGPTQQADQHGILAERQLERGTGVGDPVVLRRPPGRGTLLAFHDDL